MVDQHRLVLTMSAAKLAAVGLIAVAVAAAMALYHGVEEPAQRWMRRLDIRRVPSARDVPPPAVR